MLNPIHLQTIAAVVDTGSFADAARRLGYTSSAVSQHISHLERTLQVTLFEREAQRIRATPAAEFLANRAIEALAMLDSIEDDMRGVARGTTGRLRIGSFPTASERLLPGAVAEYLPRHPDVGLVLDEGEPTELIPRLLDGELDLALTYSYDLVSNSWPLAIRVVDLMHEDLLLLLPDGHPLVDQGNLRIEALKDLTWVTTREGAAGAACLTAICSTAGFAPRVAFRSNDYDVIHQFVNSGLGVALVPFLSHTERKGVTAHRVIDLSAQRHVYALFREPVVNPALRGMLSALAEVSSELSLASEGLRSAIPPQRGGCPEFRGTWVAI